MLPKSWNDITVRQYQELRQLGKTPADSVTERYIETILTLTDLPLDEVEEYNMRKLLSIVNQLKFVRTEPSHKYAKKIGNYSLLPFNKITWGAFIDLEFYISKDYIEYLDVIVAILLRQTKQNDWNILKYEPYEYNPKDRGGELLNAPITSIYGIVHEYLNYRNDLINNKYSELFSVGDDEDEDLDGKDLAEYNKRKNEEKVFNKWAYESITYDLADGNLTEMDNILDKSLIYVLNILSMKTETKR